MDSKKSISWFGKKEEKALSLAEEHLEKIVKVTKSMQKTIDLFSDNSNKYRKEAEKALAQERKADETKREIIQEMTKSKEGLSHIGRESIIRLVMTSDDIAENARAAVEKIKFMDPKNINDEIKEELKKLGEFALESVDLLKEAFLTTLHEDLEEAIIKTEKVEKMEEKVDHYRAKKIIPKIIKWANESTKTGNAIFLVQIENNIEEVVDQAENSADIIRELALKNS